MSNFDSVLEDGAGDGGTTGGTTAATAPLDPLEAAIEAGVAGSVPKDLTPSDLIAGTAAGEDDIGAGALSMEPNVTDGASSRFSSEGFYLGSLNLPDFTAPDGVRAPATPSLKETPWPKVLGLLE